MTSLVITTNGETFARSSVTKNRKQNKRKLKGKTMNQEMLIQPGDKLEAVTRRDENGNNDGSIIIMRYPGRAYCVAKAPRYATDEEWKHNAELIAKALLAYKQCD